VSDDDKRESAASDDPLLRAIAHAPERTPDPDPDPAPERLGQFRIDGRLGEGGMGIVYRAEDEKLGRPVALKVLPRAMGDDDESRRRFLREARAAAAINHPNVATVYEVGEADGRVYIAMELVEGETLRDRMLRAPLTVPETLRVARAVARGLARAHARGVVHRDLKPENVMLDREGEPKILDFGIAKLREVSVGGASALARTVTQATGSGHVLGTVGYMSPEQARGANVDARSDLFSLGVLLYEALAGAAPFRGETALEVLVATTRDEPPPLAELRKDLPPGLDAIVRRCLAKSPDDRYPSAEALLDALEGLDAGRAVTGDTVLATPPRRRVGAGYALAAALALALGGLVAWHQLAPSPRSAPVATAPAVATAITDYPPPKTGSPDAATDYAKAMQAIRDASFEAAVTHLLHAVDLDPSFAEAHLALAWMANETSDDARKHLASAVELRSRLRERDAAVLEAVQARLALERPDFEGEWRRWQRLAGRFPLDATIVVYAGISALAADHAAEGLALLDRARELDPKFAVADWARARHQRDVGDLEGAIASASGCLDVSPSASGCLDVRASAEQRLGRCSALERDARKMLAVDPASPNPQVWLASALVARGAPIESVAEALRHASEIESDPMEKQLKAIDATVTVSWLTGDFAAVIATFPELDRFSASVSSDGYVGQIVNDELFSLDEAGQTEAALAVADAYFKRLPVLTSDALSAGRRMALTIRRRAGRIADAEFRATREAWAREDMAKAAPQRANLAWFWYYGQPAATPADAREALDALPRYSPLPADAADVYGERVMGHVLLLAGRVDEAIPHLRRAVSGCLDPLYIPSHQLAAGMLGEALESRGDVPGACAAYDEVLAHWGNAKPRSVTADAARARAKKLGCPR
jgi:tetratricopeptide (TPR) repeat protein